MIPDEFVFDFPIIADGTVLVSSIDFIVSHLSFLPQLTDIAEIYSVDLNATLDNPSLTEDLLIM